MLQSRYYKLFIGAVMGVLCLIITSSCGNTHDYPSSLMEADSLSEVNPDSARHLLAGMRREMEDKPERVRNYYALLCIRADDKAYVRHRSSTEIERLVHYYEERKDEKLLPLAYYYAGRVYADLNDAPQALEFFQKAEKLLEGGNKNLRLLSNTYAQSGYLFMYQGLYQNALTKFQKGYALDVKLKDTTSICYSLRDMASIYNELGKRNIALTYCAEVERLALLSRNLSMLSDIKLRMAGYYLKDYKLAKAKQALDVAGAHCDSVNRSAFWDIKAEYYIKSGKMDSAYVCFLHLVREGTVYGKYDGYRWLLRYYTRRNLSKQTVSALDSFETYADSIKNIQSQEALAKANGLYNYQLRANENNRLKQEKEAYRNLLLLLSFMCITVILSGIIYRLRKDKKEGEKRLQEERAREITRKMRESSQQYITDNEKKIETFQKSLEEEQNVNRQQASQLRLQKERLQNTNQIALIQQKERKMAEKTLMDSVIYMKLKKIEEGLSPAKMTTEDWNQLETEIETCYPEFKKRIERACKINVQEYRICLLLKIKMRPKLMAELLCKSRSSISMTRARLARKALGQSASHEIWDEFIRSL